MVHKFLLTLLIMVSVFMELQAAVDVSGSGRFVSASQLDLPVDGVDDIVFTDGSAVP